jgi:hypothetical protein
MYFEAKFASTMKYYIMEGMSNEEARIHLNRRVDTAVRDYNRFVKRRSGKHNSYEVFLDFINIPLTYKGVETVRPVIQRVIEALERC